MGKSTAKRLRHLRAVSARKRVVMSFYADPSFFVLLFVAVVGAVVLGLLEKPLKWYGLVASLFFVALLFMNDVRQLACFVLFLASSAAAMERPGRINAARNAVIVVPVSYTHLTLPTIYSV